MERQSSLCLSHLLVSQMTYTTFVYVSEFRSMPNILGAILVNTIPYVPRLYNLFAFASLPRCRWENKVGLLFSVWITGVGTTGFVLSLGWLTAVTGAS